MKVVSILFRNVVVFLCLLQVRANFSHNLRELRTRTAVYHQAKATCSNLWGGKIEKLKVNLKRDLGPILHNLGRQEIDEIAADPAEVDAIVLHLCKTGRFGSDVKKERSWYSNYGSEFQPATSMDPAEATSEDSLSDILDTTLTDTSSLRTSSFLEKPIAIFIFGLVFGVCIVQYTLLKRAGTTEDSVHKLRRPEL